QAFGESFTRAWRGWRDSVTRSAAAGDATRWRDLTRSGWYVESPRWLDDTTLVYSANDGRSVTGAERVDLDGTRRRLGRRNSLAPNVPLADGSLLFSQIDLTDPFTIRSDLYLEQPSGTQRRLTVGARLSHPDARPDGTIVAVQSGAGAT